MNHDHQGPEYVRSNCGEALFAFCGIIFHGEREGIIQHPVTLRERHAVLLDICHIFLRIEIGGHVQSICTLYIYVK